MDIPRFLADEEQKHHDYIKALRDGSKELPPSRLLEDAEFTHLDEY